jgi:hypothetical protein
MDMSAAVEGVIGGLVSVRRDRNGYSARAGVLVVRVVIVALLGTTADAPVRVGRVGAGDLTPGTLVARLVFGFRCEWATTGYLAAAAEVAGEKRGFAFRPYTGGHGGGCTFAHCTAPASGRRRSRGLC